MIGNQHSFWLKFIFRMACILILVFFFAWLRSQLFKPNYLSLGDDSCLAEQRAYNQAIRDEEFAEGNLEFALNMLILALAFERAIFGTGLCSRLDLAPAAAGVFACVLAGFVGGHLCHRSARRGAHRNTTQAASNRNAVGNVIGIALFISAPITNPRTPDCQERIQRKTAGNGQRLSIV